MASERKESTRIAHYGELPVFQQASIYAWYANLERAERRRLDTLSDEAFDAEYRASREARVCYCCAREESRFWPLIPCNKGLVCANDRFCRAGTSVGSRDA